MPARYNFKTLQTLKPIDLGKNYYLPGYVAQYLTDFQISGVRFLYEHFQKGSGCIYNDESGLGKTAVVCAFLETILSKSNKKCLIILENEQQIEKWKFHFDVLTNISTKTYENDLDKDTVYFLKLQVLQELDTNFNNAAFDCIIFDARGNFNSTTQQKLLKKFEKNISIFISSKDVTLDILVLHNIFRLCGQLDNKYKSYKCFEEKFRLPNNESSECCLLEAYFQRREKIITFCREFRLRRCCHQFEEELPLCTKDNFLKQLEDWKNKINSKSSSLSSGSIYLISSSEKDTEELFETFFTTKVKKKRKDKNEMLRLSTDTSSDMIEMSPLIFEPDTDEELLLEQNIKQQNNHPKKSRDQNLSNISTDSDSISSKIQSTIKKKNKNLTQPHTTSKAEYVDVIDDTLISSEQYNNRTPNTFVAVEVNPFSSTDKPKFFNKKEFKDVFNEQNYLSSSSEFHFNLDYLINEKKKSNDVLVCTSSDKGNIICITSSSSESEITKPSKITTKISKNEKFMASPDLFDNVEEYDTINCGQNIKSSNSKEKNTKKSCLQILDRNFHKIATKKRKTLNNSNIFEITKNNVFENLLKVSAKNEISPVKANECDSNNKITNYLANNESNLQASKLNVSTNNRKRAVLEYPSTPIKRRTLTYKKSPRTCKSNCKDNKTPTSLTKWLVKSNLPSTSTKNIKRKRLDRFFKS